MPVDAQADLVAEFEKYIEQNGCCSAGRGRYAGVTSDPRRRLFRQHGVHRNDAARTYAKAPSDDDARAIERHLIEKGAKGRSRGGDESAIHVYAYRISWSTEEQAAASASAKFGRPPAPASTTTSNPAWRPCIRSLTASCGSRARSTSPPRFS